MLKNFLNGKDKYFLLQHKKILFLQKLFLK